MKIMPFLAVGYVIAGLANLGLPGLSNTQGIYVQRAGYIDPTNSVKKAFYWC